MKIKNKILPLFPRSAVIILLVCTGLFTSFNCKSNEGDPDPVTPPDTTNVKTDISYWLTNPDKSALLQKQASKLLFNTSVNQYPTIDIDTTITYRIFDKSINNKGKK